MQDLRDPDTTLSLTDLSRVVGMLVVCTQLLRHSLEVHKGQQPCDISHGKIEYLAQHLLPATVCCARNLALLASAGSKEAAAEEMNNALADAPRGLTDDAEAMYWHAAKMSQVSVGCQ